MIFVSLGLPVARSEALERPAAEAATLKTLADPANPFLSHPRPRNQRLRAGYTGAMFNGCAADLPTITRNPPRAAAGSNPTTLLDDGSLSAASASAALS